MKKSPWNDFFYICLLYYIKYFKFFKTTMDIIEDIRQEIYKDLDEE
jgi:hypothetical protein